MKGGGLFIMDIFDVIGGFVKMCNNANQNYTRKEYRYKLDKVREMKQKAKSHLSSSNPVERRQAQEMLNKAMALEKEILSQKREYEEKLKEQQVRERYEYIQKKIEEERNQNERTVICPKCNNSFNYIEGKTEFECPHCGVLLRLCNKEETDCESEDND